VKTPYMPREMISPLEGALQANLPSPSLPRGAGTALRLAVSIPKLAHSSIFVASRLLQLRHRKVCIVSEWSYLSDATASPFNGNPGHSQLKEGCLV